MTYEQAEAALVLSREQGFAFRLAEATVLRGWALVEQGQGEARDRADPPGIGRLQGHRGRRMRVYLALLVEAYRNVGQIEEGLRVIAEALAIRIEMEGRGGGVVSAQGGAVADALFRASCRG